MCLSKPKTKRIVKIYLVGYEHVGKKFFVNSVQLYLRYPSLKKAVLGDEVIGNCIAFFKVICKDSMEDQYIIKHPDESKKNENVFNIADNNVTFQFIIVDLPSSELDQIVENVTNNDLVLFFIKLDYQYKKSKNDENYDKYSRTAVETFYSRTSKIKFVVTHSNFTDLSSGLSKLIKYYTANIEPEFNLNNSVIHVNNKGFKYYCLYKEYEEVYNTIKTT